MLSKFALYLIIEENGIGKKSLSDVVAHAVSGGVTAIQLREKNSSAKDFIDLGKHIKHLLRTHRSHIPLIINDRIDIAMAIEADGVHLGQNDMPYDDARKILGKSIIIGLTVETIEQAQIASKFDVDYLGLSAVFSTRTKPEASPYWDTEKIKEIRAFTNKELIGIGGINQTNAEAILKSGLDGIALSSFICQASTLNELAARTQSLKSMLEKHYE